MKVYIIASLTVDGLIAQHSNHLADWTSKEDKQLFRSMTKASGVMVMGSNQYGTINKALPDRKTIVYSHHPTPEMKIDNVEVTQEPPKELIKRLEKTGIKELAICGGAQIYDLFLRSGAVTDIYLTVEPIMFGSGIGLLANPIELNLKLEDLRKINENTFLVHYTVA
ncbi:MAG: dihydrofolate reductase family protein [Candidatus Saccharimonadales bacterium]